MRARDDGHGLGFGAGDGYGSGDGAGGADGDGYGGSDVKNHLLTMVGMSVGDLLSSGGIIWLVVVLVRG